MEVAHHALLARTVLAAPSLPAFCAALGSTPRPWVLSLAPSAQRVRRPAAVSYREWAREVTRVGLVVSSVSVARTLTRWVPRPAPIARRDYTRSSWVHVSVSAARVEGLIQVDQGRVGPARSVRNVLWERTLRRTVRRPASRARSACTPRRRVLSRVSLAPLGFTRTKSPAPSAWSVRKRRTK